MNDKLIEAWRQTDYILYERDVVLRLEGNSEGIDQLMDEMEAGTYVFITAFNPSATPISAAENEIRHQRLVQLLTRENYCYFEGEGRPRNDDWKAEKSLLVLDIDLERAKEIARQFGQLAILYGTSSTNCHLVFLVDN